LFSLLIAFPAYTWLEDEDYEVKGECRGSVVPSLIFIKHRPRAITLFFLLFFKIEIASSFFMKFLLGYIHYTGENS
jgi:hypothetical protein